ncbi:integrator complex subunit 5 [Teleopsis dalmanni]|uniref:integrator complex subunit 5 n=1 Tax=Teleopsis dalmanni TaxID=139649 RepID=UPI0018CE7923|nr:integrator complex subunit 5 [Teleopsis dalmanni]
MSHILVKFSKFLDILDAGEDAKIFVSDNAIRESLFLLTEFQTCRTLTLKYFGVLADKCIENYVQNVIVDVRTGSVTNNGRDFDLLDQRYFIPIQAKLETLINNGTDEWHLEVLKWSLELIGSLTKKHKNYEMTIGAKTNYWLSSTTMKGLMLLTTRCICKLDSNNLEKAIVEIMSVFRRFQPDWLLVRIGNCFPHKIMSNILEFCLKLFEHEVNVKFTVEVSILDHLSFLHENDLKNALKKMLLRGLTEGPANASVVPFLLSLSNQSEIILQSLVDILYEIYDDKLLATIAKNSLLWRNNKLFMDMQPSLHNVVLRIKNHGVQLLLKLAKIASQFQWCYIFLEYSLIELEQCVLNSKLCPLINDLASEESKYLLWISSTSSNRIEQQTAIRLLLIASTQYNNHYYETISELLRKSYDIKKSGLTALIRLLNGHNGVQNFPKIKPGLDMVLQDVTTQEQFPNFGWHGRDMRISETLNVLKNLKTLLELYKQNTVTPSKETQLTAALIKCLPKLLELLEVITESLIHSMNKKAKEDLENINSYSDSSDSDDSDDVKLNFTSSELFETNSKIDGNSVEDSEKTDEANANFNRQEKAHVLVDLLNTVDVCGSSVLTTPEVLKLSSLLAKYFFFCLTEKPDTKRLFGIKRCCQLLQRLCKGRNAARTACVRELIEGALLHYGYLFGQIDELKIVDELKVPENEFVFNQNTRFNHGPVSNRTALHAGVIGHGLRTNNNKTNETYCPGTEVLFLKALNSCFDHSDIRNVYECYSSISLLLLELVCPDIMYNGLPFPEEEFTKVTMERDLFIKRAFSNSPVLWTILGYLALRRPALCFASVLLRALCATCLHQWRAKNVSKFQSLDPNEELMDCTKKLLEILATGQLLPPPLSNLSTIIEHFEPLEIALVLKECVWNYLKDYVPTPTLFQCDGTAPPWRNPALFKVQPQYVDPLRNLMQKKLTKFGSHYYQMFIMPELHNSLENIMLTEREKNEGKKT